MINKAMIEISARFQGMQPVNPNAKSARESNTEYENSTGLAEDILYYGNLLKEKAFGKIGHLYPKVHIDEVNQDATVIAWLWARTVKCPNPVCGAEVPLVHSFDLSKKKGKERHVEIHYDSNKKLSFTVESGLANYSGTINRKGAICPCCGEPVEYDYIRQVSSSNLLDSKLMAIVAESSDGRIYFSPNKIHESLAQVEKPSDVPDGALSFYPGCLNTNVYGYDAFSKLFTNRQLLMLTTLSSLLDDVCQQVEKDFSDINNFQEEAKAYSNAIRTYLAFVIDKTANVHSSFSSWMNDRGAFRETFARQAIPMVWDYAEANPFSNSGGNISLFVKRIADCVSSFPHGVCGEVVQWDATQDNGLRNIMVSTDPPYYDNIPYAYLADFFYVWLRNSLKNTYPDLFPTVLTPKASELTAIRYRFEGGREEAKSFFEDGMAKTCQNLFAYTRYDIPVTFANVR